MAAMNGPMILWDDEEREASVEITYATADHDAALNALWATPTERARPEGTLYTVTGRSYWRPLADGEWTQVGGRGSGSGNRQTAFPFWDITIEAPFFRGGAFPPFMPPIRTWGKAAA